MTTRWERRRFLATVAGLGLAGTANWGSPRSIAAAIEPQEAGTQEIRPRTGRAMKISLSCGTIGVKVDQQQAIRLADQYGFEAVTADAQALEQLSHDEMAALREDLGRRKLAWGKASLTVEFRRDETVFRNDIAGFPKTAAALVRAGVDRVGTYIRPQHAELTYLANFKQHTRRLGEVAKILADHGIRFGMEYVGPKTSWTAGRYAFLHTLAEMRELIDAIGLKNVGVVLDSWHWYTAGETVDDLLTLSNHDVVACDLNDAPTGIPVDEQIDSHRELPCATGVIDLKGFLTALQRIGYDGPMRAEPFNETLRAMPDEEAVAATAAAMKQAVALIET